MICSIGVVVVVVIIQSVCKHVRVLAGVVVGIGGFQTEESSQPRGANVDDGVSEADFLQVLLQKLSALFRGVESGILFVEDGMLTYRKCVVFDVVGILVGEIIVLSLRGVNRQKLSTLKTKW